MDQASPSLPYGKCSNPYLLGFTTPPSSPLCASLHRGLTGVWIQVTFASPTQCLPNTYPVNLLRNTGQELTYTCPLPRSAFSETALALAHLIWLFRTRWERKAAAAEGLTFDELLDARTHHGETSAFAASRRWTPARGSDGTAAPVLAPTSAGGGASSGSSASGSIAVEPISSADVADYHRRAFSRMYARMQDFEQQCGQDRTAARRQRRQQEDGDWEDIPLEDMGTTTFGASVTRRPQSRTTDSYFDYRAASGPVPVVNYTAPLRPVSPREMV